MIITCVIWIPVTALLIFLLRLWIQTRKPSLLPHLRQPLGMKTPRRPVVLGFFHPYCNAGGGGERVLWTAIRALQNKYRDFRFVIYTGDVEATGDEILRRAQQRFNITLPRCGPQDIHFVFLYKRQWVEASPYPYFTMLGQSLGSLVLGFEALWKFVPDIYLDTMGYAFTLPLFKYLGGCKVGCYVHYPTISTDMLEQVSQQTAAHNNASAISRSPLLSRAKIIYYKLFAYIYGVAGKRSDIVMVNSTWTYGHISSLWHAPHMTHIVYPPCDTKEFSAIPLKDHHLQSAEFVTSIAQFRPEKDHPLQIKAFHQFLSTAESPDKYRLLLVGSCRNDEDTNRVNSLKQLCKDLGIDSQVEFKLNVSFTELKQYLSEATIGLHTMWNEHFGIGVVEMMAAGAVTLAHNSGGPKMDIVVEYQGNKTGFLASDVDSYAAAMSEIFKMTTQQRLDLRMSARESVKRFTEQEFENGFLEATESLFLS